MREDIRRSSASPSEFCRVLMGDINLVPDGESPIDLKRPISASAQTEFVPSPSRPFKALWMAILNSLAEVCAPYPTHLDIANLKLDRIDRTFTTAPRSMLNLLSSDAGVIKSPESWFQRGLSDHSPNFWSPSLPKPQPASQLRLKKE